MSRCRRRCRYRGNGWPENSDKTPGCEYILLTGKSRVKAAMELVGTDKLTDEVKELLRPDTCPFFEKGSRPKEKVNPMTGELRDG